MPTKETHPQMGVNLNGKHFILFYFLFQYFQYFSIVTIEYYMLQVYSIVIHSFKGFIPFIVFIKYWLYSPCCTLYLLVYFGPNSLYVLVLYPYIAPPPATGNHWFVLYICESPSFLLYSLVCCIFQIPHISDIKNILNVQQN